MPMIQVQLSDIESQILNIYRSLKNIKNKKKAVKELILEKKYLLDKLKEENN